MTMQTGRKLSLLLFSLFILSILMPSCGDEPAAVVNAEDQAKAVLMEEKVAQDITYHAGQEIEFRTSDQLTLKGNVYKDSVAVGNAPCAVIIGAPDGSDTASVRYLATQLSARGIICCTFFPRGVGGSGGIVCGHNYEWQKDDAQAAMKKMLQDQDINPAQTGYIGMDQGAELALFTSAASATAAYGIAGSLPLVSAENKLARGINDGNKTALIAAQHEFRTGKIDFPTLVSRQNQLKQGMAESTRVPMTAEDNYWVWYDSWLSMSSPGMLAKLRHPMLLLYGAADPYKADEAEDVADDNPPQDPKGSVIVEEVTDGSLADAYSKQQLTDKTIARIATWIHAQGAKK